MALNYINFSGNLSFSGTVAVEDGDSPGGGGNPAWVPDGYSIWVEPRVIDGFPAGRAWVEGVGEVAVDTLLGGDVNTEGYWGPTEYNAGGLAAGGYSDGFGAVAAIGALRDALIAGSTFVLTMNHTATVQSAMIYVAASGGAALTCEQAGANFEFYSLGPYANELGAGTPNSLNRLAGTVTPLRAEFSLNGSAAIDDVLGETDWPTSGEDEIVAVAFDIDYGGSGGLLYSIGVRSVTLPDSSGLQALSALA